MNMKLGAILILIFATSAFALDPYCGRRSAATPDLSHLVPDEGTPIQVQVYMRHGDRTGGGNCWPNDNAVYDCSLTYASMPSLNESQTATNVPRLYRRVFLANDEDHAGNCQDGQLTEIGYDQQVANGEWLRSLYGSNMSFLSPSYIKSENFFRADNSDRTIQSAQSLIWGLYPPNTSNGQAELVDIYTMDGDLDYIYPNTGLCPLRQKHIYMYQNSTEYIQFNATFTYPLMEKLAPFLNVSVDEVSIGGVLDCMHVHICHGFPVPQFLTDLYDDMGKNDLFYANISYLYPNRTFAGKVNSGPLMYKMYQYMEQVKNGTSSNPKFILWSAHDTDVMPMLAALGVWDHAWCPYAGMMVMDVWKDVQTPSSFGVRILWNEAPVQIPECDYYGQFCDYDSFVALLSTMMISDPETQCAYNPHEDEFYYAQHS